MILISHRGNINGKKPNYENKPEYIWEALRKGYHCEVDVWFGIMEGKVKAKPRRKAR